MFKHQVTSLVQLLQLQSIMSVLILLERHWSGTYRMITSLDKAEMLVLHCCGFVCILRVDDKHNFSCIWPMLMY